MKRCVLSWAAVAALVCVPAASAHIGAHSQAYENWHDSNTSTELGLNFRNQLATGNYRTYLPGAAQKWANASSRIGAGTQQGTAGVPCTNTPPQGVVCVSDEIYSSCYNPFGTGCIGGYAELHVAPDGHAWRGLIKLNAYYRSNVTYAQYITCHEVGHAVGLEHRGDSGSCINPADTTGLNVTSGDAATVDYIYSVADSGGDYAGCLAGSDGPCWGPPSSSSPFPIAAPTPDPRGNMIAVLAIDSLARVDERGRHLMCEDRAGSFVEARMDLLTPSGIVEGERTFPC
jgi:hypothetical protein